MPNDSSAEDYSANIHVFTPRGLGGASPPGPPLQPPGGGGTYDGMLEARVARLEADVGHIQRDVSEIKDVIKGVGKDLTDLKVSDATMTERVSNLPTTGKSVLMLLMALGVIAALVVFQGQIQKYMGTSSLEATTVPPKKS